MANNFFQFKQFTIHQDKCAMKVSTLACIQGAWLPDFSPRNILDVGAGTGILSLMAAQKYKGDIDSVEIEPEAFIQLQANISGSPWRDRIHCFHNDIRDFAKQNSKRYDFILSNPPFFENLLKSQDPKINQARHDISLILTDLIDAAVRILSDHGKISILLPPGESQRLASHCLEKPLFLSDQLVISDMPGKSVKGIINILSRLADKPRATKLFIKTKNGHYSSAFNHLLKDYYLYL